MSDSLVFSVPGDPVPKARPRIGKGKAYTPQRTKDWEAEISWNARLEMHKTGADIFTKPVAIEMVFRYGNRNADLDNLIKAVLDALNGVAWQDDVLVEGITARIQRGCPKYERGVGVKVWTLIPITELESALDLVTHRELFLKMDE